ncbi:hypothetical protein HPB47_001125 [Ixodes persulcatus]|uniref:Uncharacterized protein n=1 Tax=Ixodes persulcatus TaxID=34615 RepID=A0AC60PPV5_IXOPE|nr:hypothetical protein HPB47_001125 [Ixodes persulcatus]
MEHALLTRINSHLEDTSAYPHSIIGFRAHLTTQDAMLQLKHQILDGKSRHTKAILGLDLERAFDSVAHSTILERISLLNLGERTYNYVRDFLSNRRAYLSVGDIQSEEFTLGCVGTPQGSVISPMLFNLVMLGLAQELQKLDGIEHTIYADDITIWARTGSDDQIETALQDAIDASELLLYHPTLCGRPPLGSTHKSHYEEFQLHMRDGGTIPVVSTIRVLGMTIEANGANSTAISKILRQTANTSRLLKRVTNRRQGMKEESLIRLVHSFVICHIAYVAAFHDWYKAEKTKLDIIIRGAYKLALGLPNNTSTELLLQLGLHNTLDELIEAQRRSHLERLTLTETGRHILTKLGITYHPYGDTTGVTFVDAAEYQDGHRFAAATTVGGSLKRAASIVTQNAETAEEVAIALTTLDPDCHTIVSDSRTAISNYIKGRISQQALRILHQSPHSTENQITLVWFPAHAGDVHPHLSNLNEVAHSLARGLVNRAGDSAGAPAERDRLTSYNDLTKSFYLERKTFPTPHHKLNRAQATTLHLLQTNTWHAALRSSHLDDQLWATQQACEAAKRQDLDVPTWEA